ncbi:MAG: cytochrome c oxidase subunit II [Acidobacteriia bacterium]|nr:cytochrome c oxidase subunit II [Methyloceanibacter sp.]MCL6490859.1 cytochrome c oxidase subunit II [Terriglobia bacterium]
MERARPVPLSRDLWPMHVLLQRIAALPALFLFCASFFHRALAQAPTPWEVGMQPGFSPVKREIIALHDFVLVIITLICLLVAGLLIWVLYRYSAKRNPNPTRTAHNTVLEITWTVVPVLILVIIAIPSFRLVYYEDRTHDPDLTLKVTAHQWYWEYAYPDQGGLNVESHLVPDDALKPGQPRLLTVDQPIELPVGKNVRILITSSDVIHSFLIPSLGVQRYAIPGREIETWVRIDKPGTYYGECNQICGIGHSQMPIEVKGVSTQEFAGWVKQMKAQQSSQNRVPAEPASAALPPAMKVTEN